MKGRKPLLLGVEPVRLGLSAFQQLVMEPQRHAVRVCFVRATQSHILFLDAVPDVDDRDVLRVELDLHRRGGVAFGLPAWLDRDEVVEQGRHCACAMIPKIKEPHARLGQLDA